MQNIFVVGAGQMGGGIAQVAAQAGYKVILNDIKDEFVEKGIAGIEKNLSKMVAKEKISAEDKGKILGNITKSTDVKDAVEADLVIEAIIENADIKKKLFQDLDKICPANTIFASNTSSLPITQLASYTSRPDKFIGMHFMNPVPVMKLVEVIRGLATSDEVFQAVNDLSVKMGKTPVPCNDFPGFVINRILIPMINEAVYCLHEGVGTPENIDEIMKLGANQPMGPLALADLIGLDTVLSIMEVLHDGFADSKYRPCPLLKKYVNAGWLGRKSGRGFYNYN